MKENPDTHPHLFRIVPYTEAIHGDLFKDLGAWQQSGGGICASPDLTYYRRLPFVKSTSDWIKVQDRQPTEADYQGDLGLLGLDADGKANVYIMDETGPKFQSGHKVTHWMRITPPAELPITVGQYTVEFRNDGSLKVGCTKVSKATMEKIVKRWENK